MLQTIGFAMLALSGLLLLLSLILAVAWHIPSLIDELSGRKARRQIERMRKLNLASSNFSVTDTSEFYRSMNGGDLPDKDFKPSNSGNELNRMVNNPYKFVPQGQKNKASSSLITPIDVEESVTSFMEEINLKENSQTKGRYIVKIIEEQTSL